MGNGQLGLVLGGNLQVPAVRRSDDAGFLGGDDAIVWRRAVGGRRRIGHGCTGAGGSPGSARANGAVTASAHTAVAAARLFSMGVAPLVLRCEEFEWVSFICQTALVMPM